MAEKKKMSVAEILAAARKSDGSGEGPAEPPAVSAEPPAAESAPAAAAPEKAAAKPKLKPGERPSVADIMAMARGGGGGQADKPAAAKPKPAAAAKGQAKPAAKAKPGPAMPAERMDTASILASARKEAKRGPVSKAEAASLPGAKKAAAAKPKLPAPKMPERPVYVSPPAASQAAPDQRRRSLVFGAIFGTFLATGMTLLTATVGLWTLAFARFMFPNILTEPPSKFKIGFPDGIAPGTVETKFKAQFGVWVVNYEFQGQPMIYALSTVCTHLGCTPNWLDAEQKFKCPCHGSGFYKDGVNFEGPAPRPLERYAIRIADDGQLEIDKSQKFQEEMGQWEDTASYVPV